MSGNDLRFRALLDDKVSSGLDRIKDKLDKTFGKGTASTAFGVAAAKGLDVMAGSALKAGEIIGDFAQDSIAAASNLQQSAGAVESVFGRASDKVAAFGETAADAFGLSKREVNELGAVVGAQLTGMGFSIDAAAESTINLEKRAADMAATFGGPTSQAVESISALLRGERDPIEKYGVSIKDADVKARILAKGLDTSTAAAEKNATAVASLELLMESTAKTTGQFSREADSLAGAQARAHAEMENAQASLGEGLLPTQLKFTKALIDYGIPALELWADKLSVVTDLLDHPDPMRLLETAGELTPLGIAFKAAGLGGDVLAKSIRVLTGEEGRLEQAERELLAANVARLAASKTAAEHADDVRERTKDLAFALDDEAGSAKNAGDKTEDAFRRSSKAVSGLDATIDRSKGKLGAYFLLLTTNDDLAATNAEINAQRRIIASSTATAAEKADATARLHQLQADQLDYLETLAAGGKAGTAEFTKSIEKLNSDLSKSHGEEADRIREEIRLLNLLAAKAALAKIFDKGSGYVTSGIKSHAEGGRYKAGELRLVGERGPELDIPDHSGTIVSHEDLVSMAGAGGDGYVLPNSMTPARSGGGPGGLTVVFNSTWPPTPEQARQVAEVVDRELGLAMGRAPQSSW